MCVILESQEEKEDEGPQVAGFQVLRPRSFLEFLVRLLIVNSLRMKTKGSKSASILFAVVPPPKKNQKKEKRKEIALLLCCGGRIKPRNCLAFFGYTCLPRTFSTWFSYNVCCLYWALLGSFGYTWLHITFFSLLGFIFSNLLCSLVKVIIIYWWITGSLMMNWQRNRNHCITIIL